MTASPIRQLALQAAATILVLSLAWPYHLVTRLPLDWNLAALLIGIAAFCLASWGRLPWWWRLIHLIFAPAAALVAGWQIDPFWFLLGFMLLLLLYRGALAGQVPLFLSSDEARDALLELVRERRAGTVIDLGAGIGSVLAPLAAEAPGVRWIGVENAPLNWLLLRLRCLGLRNCECRYGDLWATPLGEPDIVYAFLSPVPMPALWQKALREMRPGTLLVSNSFAVPGIEATLQVDAGGRLLFAYAIPDRHAEPQVERPAETPAA